MLTITELPQHLAELTAVQEMTTEHLRGLTAAQRAARTNNPFDGINLKSRAGRRIRDLVESMTLLLAARAKVAAAKLVANPLVMTKLRTAAELIALAEDFRAIVIRRGPGASSSRDLINLVRLEGAAERALIRTGIEPGELPRARKWHKPQVRPRKPRQAQPRHPGGRFRSRTAPVDAAPPMTTLDGALIAPTQTTPTSTD